MAHATLYVADSRSMHELADESIALVVTSPPYWHIKDYGVPQQIGYGQSLHEYLHDLARVWGECWRVLQPGRRLCINVGDQFARAVVYGQYKVIPLHAEIIIQCERIGFDYLGAIIKMIEMGLARASRSQQHRYYQRFIQAEPGRQDGK